MSKQQRTLRNYLIDPVFQFKYTGMVVGFTLLVSSFLGYEAYDASRHQGEVMTSSALAALGPDSSTAMLLIQQSEAAQRTFGWMVVGGIALLCLILALVGIVVTHKIVGPAYRMKRLFEDLASGHLRVSAKIRKGDELHDVFEAYERLIDKLRERQAGEIAKLDAAIAALPAGVDAAQLQTLRAEMQRELDG